MRYRPSVARALQESFPYVGVYESVEGWGLHFLASMTPIAARTPAELVARMPPGAVTDMMEWGPAKTPEQQFDLMLAQDLTVEQIIAFAPDTPALRDDRPVNEYFLFRTSTENVLSMQRITREQGARGTRVQ